MLKFRTVVIDGVSLDVPGGCTELTPEEQKGITDVLWVTDDYFNDKTIQRMAGNSERVRIVLEHIRDKTTVDPGGNLLAGLLIRRIELNEVWKTGEIWTIKKARHLFREERRKDAPGASLKFLCVPKLGKIRVGDTMVELPPFDLSKAKDERPPHSYTEHFREPGS